MELLASDFGGAQPRLLQALGELSQQMGDLCVFQVNTDFHLSLLPAPVKEPKKLVSKTFLPMAKKPVTSPPGPSKTKGRSRAVWQRPLR